MAHLYIPKDSAHITRVLYTPDDRTLAVTFANGSTYRHFDVPYEAYDNMTKYRSAGEFYHGVIKRNYKISSNEKETKLPADRLGP